MTAYPASQPENGQKRAAVDFSVHGAIRWRLARCRLHLLVGEDGMSHDAPFQLRMGSVLLNASQKEETFAASALTALTEATCIGSRAGLAAHAAARRHAEKKSRNNSAKALI
ncbi:hypothetical protein [Bosea sp. NPDC055594]